MTDLFRDSSNVRFPRKLIEFIKRVIEAALIEFLPDGSRVDNRSAKCVSAGCLALAIACKRDEI